MSEYTSIYTIRHGETDYTLQKRYAGSLDVPLNKAGIEDAKIAAKKLVDMRFDAVITSTLIRSIETARLFLGADVKLIQCSFCNERDYGAMQGLTENEVKLMKPKVNFVKVGNDYHSLNPPGGERFEILRERALKFYKLVLNQYKGLTVLIFSHGVFLQQFHGLLRGLDWKQALAINVRSLELNIFHLNGTHLMKQSTLKLAERDQRNW